MNAGPFRRIGHNGGPTLEDGWSWRRHCWGKARSALLPRLPVEVIRLRVKRAKELGLDYKTYAGVRATTGHDIVAFLFSSNALGLKPDGRVSDRARGDKIGALAHVDRLLAAQPPFRAEDLRSVLAGQGLDFRSAMQAPGLSLSWGGTRRALCAFLAGQKLPTDRVLVIGETALERDWVGAASMAGFVHADRYFASPSL